MTAESNQNPQQPDSQDLETQSLKSLKERLIEQVGVVQAEHAEAILAYRKVKNDIAIAYRKLDRITDNVTEVEAKYIERIQELQIREENLKKSIQKLGNTNQQYESAMQIVREQDEAREKDLSARERTLTAKTRALNEERIEFAAEKRRFAQTKQLQ